MKEYKIEFIISEGDFYHVLGRWPDDEAEYKHFCEQCEKGLRNDHIDWNIIFDCAKEAIENA